MSVPNGSLVRCSSRWFLDWAWRLLLVLDLDLLPLLRLLGRRELLERDLRVDLEDATLLSDDGRVLPLDLDRLSSPLLFFFETLSERPPLGSRLRELGSRPRELDRTLAASDLSLLDDEDDDGPPLVDGRSFLLLLLRRLPLDSALLLEPKLWSNPLASSSSSSSLPKRLSSSSVSSSSSSSPSDMNLPSLPLLCTLLSSMLRQSGQAFINIFQPGPKSLFLRSRILGWWMQ